MKIRLLIVAAWLCLVIPTIVLINMANSYIPLPYPPVLFWAVISWVNTACLALFCWLIGQREAAKIFICVMIGLPIGVSISLIKT